MMARRIYLDNAATSWPKPEAVYAAVDRYQRELGAAVGRGSSRVSLEVQRVVDRCRQQVARFLGAASPEQVFFTYSGTDSLNLALHGLLGNSSDSGATPHVVTTVWEHNSVLRPLHSLEQRQQIRTTIIQADQAGQIDLQQLEEALKQPTRLVAVTHASNVTGVIQPIQDVARLAHAAGALVLLDAAQTAGHLPISITELGVDLFACPGHKGLMGPLGTGLLVVRPGLENELKPLRQGGTGTVSESREQPRTGPERFEAGNHNAPGIFGLNAGIEFLEECRGHAMVGHVGENSALSAFIEGVRALPGIAVHFPDSERVNVVSVSAERIAPQVFASLLDQHFGIETRAGLHCVPLAHEALGTLHDGGTVRFSTGPFTTADEIDATLEALAQIVAAM